MIALGVGLSSAASAEELADLTDAVLSRAGLSRSMIALVGTTERLAGDPRVLSLDLAVRGFARDLLAEVSPSVCEAAAMLAVHPPATLLVSKVTGVHTTVAVACSADTAGSAASTERSPGPWPDSRSFC
jgi:cobalamin biosynthesis protein CbiG